MLSTQTALVRRFFTCFSLDCLFGWWQLKHFFMFTPKIGEDEANFDFRICFLDGLVKNPQRVVYVASMISMGFLPSPSRRQPPLEVEVQMDIPETRLPG